LVDEIIQDSKIESNGAYTSVGTYSHIELFKLVDQLSKHSNISIEKLMTDYGKYAFYKFIKAYPKLTNNFTNAFHFLKNVEDIIHVEVAKLYPNTELPSLKIIELTEKEMKLLYSSQRRMSHFAEGMILSCFDYYHEKVVIEKEVMNGDGAEVLFSIKKEG
jgi:hypothetical protein